MRKTAVAGPGPSVSHQVAESHKRDFWIKENLKHKAPHFRLRKCGRIVNGIAKSRQCDLLDVGCGPATLSSVLHENIHYYGLDLAIQTPADNLLEVDILKAPIAFGNMKFDIVVAQGLFEYLGSEQSLKLREIAQILRENGAFVVSYTNFGHRDTRLFEAFSNVQPLSAFKQDLARSFRILKSFPTSYNWHGGQPSRKIAMAVNMPVVPAIPVVSAKLAVEYFFICSKQ